MAIIWLGETPADVWLSVDGGNSYEELGNQKGGNAQNTLGLTA